MADRWFFAYPLIRLSAYLRAFFLLKPTLSIAQSELSQANQIYFLFSRWMSLGKSGSTGA